MNRVRSSIVALGLLALVACDKKADAGAGAAATATAEAKASPGKGACYHADTSMCVQYATLSAAETASEKQDCEKEKGTWSASCPTEDLLGTCTNPKKGGDLQMKLYKGKSFASAEEAKKAMCSDAGDVFAAAK